MSVARTTIRFLIPALLVLGGLASCGGDKLVDNTCDEPQRYQRAVAGKKIVAPEGLDPLDPLAEMPIPKPQEAPVRAPGSACIELPPAVATGK